MKNLWKNLNWKGGAVLLVLLLLLLHFLYIFFHTIYGKHEPKSWPFLTGCPLNSPEPGGSNYHLTTSKTTTTTTTKRRKKRRRRRRSREWIEAMMMFLAIRAGNFTSTSTSHMLKSPFNLPLKSVVAWFNGENKYLGKRGRGRRREGNTGEREWRGSREDRGISEKLHF